MSFKKRLIGLFCLLFFISFTGYSRQQETQVAANRNAFSLASNDLRSLQNSVNLFTGQVAFPLNLLDVGAIGGVSYPITINYSSAVDKQVSTWNKEVPNSTVGLGWSMSVPRIIVDNKSTGTREDDDFYINANGVNIEVIILTCTC